MNDRLMSEIKRRKRAKRLAQQKLRNGKAAKLRIISAAEKHGQAPA